MQTKIAMFHTFLVSTEGGEDRVAAEKPSHAATFVAGCEARWVSGSTLSTEGAMYEAANGSILLVYRIESKQPPKEKGKKAPKKAPKGKAEPKVKSSPKVKVCGGRKVKKSDPMWNVRRTKLHYCGSCGASSSTVACRYGCDRARITNMNLPERESFRQPAAEAARQVREAVASFGGGK